MIDLLSTSQLILREARFATTLRPLGGSTVVCFEDASLLGFCSTFESVGALVEGWRKREMAILREFAPNFAEAGDKAWNVYCAFLTSENAERTHVRQVRWIEEDLERTRKIAVCGVASREDLVRAFLPVLPLQHQAQLQAEDGTERLKNRIEAIAPKAKNIALDDSVPPTAVIQAIGESS